MYKALAGWVVNAFCWAHLRRRLLKSARDEHTPAAARWAENWRLRIHTLYELTAARRARPPPRRGPPPIRPCARTWPR